MGKPKKRTGKQESGRAQVSKIPQRDSRAEANDVDERLNDGHPHIVRAVELGGVVYKKGDEDALADADGFDGAMIMRLTTKGAIVGFEGGTEEEVEG